MLDFLDGKFRNYWNTYLVEKNIPDYDKKFCDKIWICWWQSWK